MLSPLLFYLGDSEYVPAEEENVADDTTRDLDLLSEVDNILLDDDLLSVTVPAALKQIRPSTTETMRLAIAILCFSKTCRRHILFALTPA